MPRGDGTGPRGEGPGTGRGMGKTAGGQGRRFGYTPGPGGNCICPECGEKSAHQQGHPCFDQKCPKCGTLMIRE